jgi:hypothetical protein
MWNEATARTQLRCVLMREMVAQQFWEVKHNISYNVYLRWDRISKGKW